MRARAACSACSMAACAAVIATARRRPMNARRRSFIRADANRSAVLRVEDIFASVEMGLARRGDAAAVEAVGTKVVAADGVAVTAADMDITAGNHATATS